MTRRFRCAALADIPELQLLLEDCKKQMRNQHITQWTETYPNINDLEEDIRKRELFVIEDKSELACVGTLSKNSFSEKIVSSKTDRMFLKRLMTSSKYTRQGIAQEWLMHALKNLSDNQIKHLYSCTNYTNIPMQHYFQKNSFIKVNEVLFDNRYKCGEFYVYERKVGNLND